ncbi:hypothetical protein Bca101_087770 [Brassica carinata]
MGVPDCFGTITGLLRVIFEHSWEDLPKDLVSINYKAQTHITSYPPPQPAPPATSSSPPHDDDRDHASDYTHLRHDARDPHTPALSERVRERLRGAAVFTAGAFHGDEADDAEDENDDSVYYSESDRIPFL